MDNGEKILHQLDKMDEKLDKNNELTQDNSKQIGLINQSLRGNGGKGLFQRVDDAENWQEKHEEKTEKNRQLSRKEIMQKRAIEATIIGIVVGIIIAAVNWLI